MKINLLYGVGDYLNGYLNIHPFSVEETDSLKIGDVKNLDKWVQDAEAKEILATDVIDYLPLNEVNPTITNWVKKLRHKGTLVIGGVDLFEISKGVYQYELDIPTANKLLHGLQQEPHLFRRANFTIFGITDYLANTHGLVIMKKRITGYTYTVEAIRP